MNNKLLDLTRPVQTRSGKPVTILTIKGRTNYPVIGYIGDEEHPSYWTMDGISLLHDGYTANLINTPQPNANQVGKFSISTHLFKEWKSLLPLFSQMVVTFAQYKLDNDEMEYIAYSPLFDEVETCVPHYKITIQKDPPIITATRI